MGNANLWTPVGSRKGKATRMQRNGSRLTAWLRAVGGKRGGSNARRSLSQFSSHISGRSGVGSQHPHRSVLIFIGSSQESTTAH